MEPRINTEISAPMRECIDTCQDCHNLCLETTQYCLKKGGEHAELSHIRLMLDCVQISQASADFMTRNSPLHGQVCSVCAEACEQCAESCAKFKGDPAMQECADMCRSCSDSCRKMGSTV